MTTTIARRDAGRPAPRRPAAAVGGGRVTNPFGVESLGPDDARWIVATEGTTAAPEGTGGEPAKGEPAKGASTIDAGGAAPDPLRLAEEALARPGARVGLVGPHGAGKSTLAVEIARRWRVRGRRVAFVRTRDERRWPPVGWWGEAVRADLVVVDGAEVLARPARWAMRLLAAAPGVSWLVSRRRRHRGRPRWLMTLHAPRRGVASISVRSDPAALAALIAARLEAIASPSGRGPAPSSAPPSATNAHANGSSSNAVAAVAPDADVVARWLAATAGDARALLFLLYDAFEEGGPEGWRAAAERRLHRAG